MQSAHVRCFTSSFLTLSWKYNSNLLFIEASLRKPTQKKSLENSSTAETTRGKDNYLQMSYKIGFFKNLAKIHRKKYALELPFNKVKALNFIKKGHLFSCKFGRKYS